MIVLGLHGWRERTHDAAACLIRDGSVVACAEEERFVRKKHAYDMPAHNATRFCLDAGGLTLDDVDVVSYGWDLKALYKRHRRDVPSEREIVDFLLPKALFERSREPVIQFVGHHEAHAASAYFASGFESCAVLVVDGQGETASASLAHATSAGIAFLECFPIGWSLGYFYEAVSEFCGLGNNPGKLMGLAGHGQPGAFVIGLEATEDDYAMPVPRTALDLSGLDEQRLVVGNWLDQLARRSRRPPNAGSPLLYADIAAGAQAELENAMLALVRRVCRLTGERKLAMSGGVALNALVNGRVIRERIVDELFVQPIAHDAGAAVGSAMYVASGSERIWVSPGVDWGPSFGDETIRREVAASGYTCDKPADVAEAAADVISAGGVVGWFTGKAEVGPRALGRRSLLASPRSTEMRDRVNREIKHREMWRPLAPSILEAAAPEYVDIDVPMRHMIVATSVRDEKRDRIAGVVHVDGTARPQTVPFDASDPYARLLKALETITGDPVVMNTSFNGKDEPMVHSPTDALADFRAMGLDALVLGPYIVSCQ